MSVNFLDGLSESVRTLTRYHTIEDPQVNPADGRVAFAEVTVRESDLTYRSALWLIDADDSEPRRLTHSDAGEEQPRWSPDRRSLAYRSDRGAGSQIFRIDVETGSETQITALPGGVSDYSWAPDGRHIVAVGRGEALGRPSTARRIVHAHYKSDGVGFLNPIPTSLWLIPLDGAESPRKLTYGSGNVGQPAWSPDGQKIAFTRERSAKPIIAPYTDIWTVDMATGEERNLTDGRGPSLSPAWSPDGSTIGFIGHTEPRDLWWATNFQVWTVSAGGGEPACLTLDFDRFAGRVVFGDLRTRFAATPLAWSSNGTALHFLATIGGEVHLHSVSVADLTIRQRTSGRIVVREFAETGNNFVILSGSATNPGDLYRVDGAGQTIRLTDRNAAVKQAFPPVDPESVISTSFDGTEVESWLYRPRRLDETSRVRYPLVLAIHGGPHGAWGEAYNHAFQTLAAEGYFVLAVNPRGSQGYGQEFAALAIGDFVDGPMADLLGAVDRVIETEPIDETRLAAFGGSYGGLMTAWIAGHTDRFAALISRCPTVDLLTFYGESDIGHYFMPFELGGVQPWDEPDVYRVSSPLTYAPAVSTPVLLIHHELDLRCPISQSEQFFTTLKALDKRVEFLRIANASHGVVPAATAEADLIALDATIEWLDRWFDATRISSDIRSALASAAD